MPNYHLPPGIHFRGDLGNQAKTISLVAWSPDGKTLVSSSQEQLTVFWEWPAGNKGNTIDITFDNMAWSPDGETLACATDNCWFWFWNKYTGWEEGTYIPSDPYPAEVIYAEDGRLFLYQTIEDVITLTNIKEEQNPSFHVLHYPHANNDIRKLLFSPNQQMLACLTDKGEVALWERPLDRMASPTPIILQKQLVGVSGLAWSPDARVLAVYGMQDDTILLLNAVEKKEKRLLKGHTDKIVSVAFSPDGKLFASKSLDGVLHFWRTDTWEAIATVTGMFAGDETGGLAFHPTTSLLAVYGSEEMSGGRGTIHLLELDVKTLLKSQPTGVGGHFYKNAKVVLVGDSGVGKSGLSLVLTGRPFVPTESTHGRHIWTLESRETPLADKKSEIREILLWDLAGQPGYRLIHQLHLSEVSAALIVTDTHSETDPFSGVHHWVRALNVAQQNNSLPIKKLLVQARIDRGGIRASRTRVEAFVKELNLDGYIETSAKEHLGIAELQQMIRDAIDWDALPKVSSTPIFQKINAFLLAEKARSRVLSTLDEVYRAFLQTARDLRQEENLRVHFETCIDQIESQGLIRKLSFGNLILLQPELLDVYASALVNAVRDEPDGLGSMAEEDIRAGNFFVPLDQRLMNKEQEKMLLIAMIEDLLRSEVALRERAEDGPYLVFPSQSTRENPDLPDPEEKAVIFRFEGPLQNIYATLAVRLAHSGLFKLQTLWRDAITYTTSLDTGASGILLRNFGEGWGELTLFFEHGVRKSIRALFEEFVQAHLQQRSLPESVRRQSIVRCHNCGTPFTNIQIERRLQRGFNSITCSTCDEITSLLEKDDEVLARKARTIVSEMDHIANVQREREVIDSTHANRWSTMEEITGRVLKELFQKELLQEFDSAQVDTLSIKGLPSNPYYEYSAVHDSENFFGRAHLLENLYQALSHRQCVSLTGFQHIGKSSLLKYMQLPKVQAQHGYNLGKIIFVSLDMSECLHQSRKDFFFLLNQRIKQQQSRGRLEFIHVDGESIDVFRHLLEQMKQQGYYPILIMDEFDKIVTNPEFDADFFSFLRALASTDLVSYITASLKPLHKIIRSHEGSPFFNIFSPNRLGPLTIDEAKDLIIRPASQANLPFTKLEVDRVLELAGCHPFFLQRVCHSLFELKAAQKKDKITQHISENTFDQLQERVYQELLPHFDNQWNYLDTKEQEVLSYEAASNDKTHRKLPELSESSLFRKFVREKRRLSLSQMDARELQGILTRIGDAAFLGNCNLASWNIITASTSASASLREKGLVVSEVLNKALEQLKGDGIRNDRDQDWTLYNILYYRYFKSGLANQQAAHRIGISERQFYRYHLQALEKLLNALLDMERVSLGKD